MRHSVFIDSGAWNWLFEHHVNLQEVFPPEAYSLFITREIEIELYGPLTPIPDSPAAILDIGKDGKDKRALKGYIQSCIKSYGIQTTCVFGFAEAGEKIYGGFGSGTFQSDADRTWYQDNFKLLKGKPPRNAVLVENQADASLAVRSYDSIILTNEPRVKKHNKDSGPLQLKVDQRNVVYLQEVDTSGLSLKDYIARLLDAIG